VHAGSAIAWFEIPSKDLDRATRFYEDVLDVKLKPDAMGPMKMSLFPADKGQPSGCVIHADGYRPSAESREHGLLRAVPRQRG
jgi:predicted enzyme related to lactoylglutathione lyase